LQNQSESSANNRPLGESLLPRWLDHDVVTCVQAASAKGIPLENELKTLVVRTTNGVYAVNVRGNQAVSLRAVKRFLHVREAHLLSALELRLLGLTPGTVCPVLAPVWNMRQLLSTTLLNLDFVTTNNGCLSGYFVFSPQLLLKLPNLQVGDFETKPPSARDQPDEV
jgi:prolyl-tRNA editing enzyme YbaK/EbsC (Cys-tRNA(Pro) deacylase)